ncbi:hypothetical protein Tco_1341173 [Tanacetum coccineum]
MVRGGDDGSADDYDDDDDVGGVAVVVVYACDGRWDVRVTWGSVDPVVSDSHLVLVGKPLAGNNLFSVRARYVIHVHDLGSVETEFPSIVFNDTLTSEPTLSCEPTVSSLNNDEIDFRISFEKSDNKDCTVIFDKNTFSYKIISVNDLKPDSENDNYKANMPLTPSTKPTVSYFDDLDFFKDFENEFLAIVYNDAQMSKSDLLTEPILNPEHIDEFNLKDETSLSEYDEEEQNIICFNDLFPLNVIYPDELKTDTDNDNDKVTLRRIYLSNHYLM